MKSNLSLQEFFCLDFARDSRSRHMNRICTLIGSANREASAVHFSAKTHIGA